jgi:hypothetical protein
MINRMAIQHQHQGQWLRFLLEGADTRHFLEGDQEMVVRMMAK